MGLEEQLLNESDILSYARAAISIGNSVKELSKEKGVNILIPSRGSYPLWNLAKKYLYLQKHPFMYEETKNTNIPIDGLFPKESYEEKNGHILVDPTKLNRDIILPVSSFAEDHSSTKKLREFWINTYEQIKRQNNNDLGVKSYRYMLENVSRFLTDKEKFDEDLALFTGKTDRISGMESLESYVPQTLADRKTLLIDTVLSGTCAIDLIGSMENLGMDYHAILVTNNNGKDVKPRNRCYLSNIQSEGKLTEVPIPNIFTEDNGPGLLGVTTIVYPSIMEQFSKSTQSADHGQSFTGAACWMPLPYTTLKTGQRVDVGLRSSSYLTKVMLTEALAIEMYSDGFKVEGLEYGDLIESFEKNRSNLIEILKNQKLLDANNTLAQYKTFLREIVETEDITTTRSHVIKVNYSPEKSAKIVSDFYKSLRN